MDSGKTSMVAVSMSATSAVVDPAGREDQPGVSEPVFPRLQSHENCRMSEGCIPMRLLSPPKTLSPF